MLSQNYESLRPVIDSSADYLSSTRYCDVDSPEIRETAARLTHGLGDPAAKAAALFEWTRDRVVYRLGLYPDFASETLRKGEGSCSNKSNLLVALLRASSIPAGYHRIVVDTRRYIGPLCSWRFAQFMSEKSLHVYTGIQIGGRWIQCDASDDAALAHGASHLNPQATLVEFDGTRTSLLHLDPDHILARDDTCSSTMDEVFEKRVRVSLAALRAMNAYIDFVRFRGQCHDSPVAIEAAFWRWFTRARPAQSAAFLLAEARLRASTPNARAA